MNKFTLLGMVLVTSLSIHAQKVTVKQRAEKVKGEAVDGYGTEVDGKKDAVNAAWIKFLREIGKVRQSVDPVTVTEPTFNGLTFSKGTLYCLVRDGGEHTSVWIGIVPAEWEAKDVKRINNELEKSIAKFGLTFYRDKIQVQIDEAQQAIDAVEKQKQRLLNQTKDLNIQLSNNQQEKVQLDKSLDANKFENAVLQVKLANNVKAQDSLAAAGLQIQKVKQMHAERQRQVAVE